MTQLQELEVVVVLVYWKQKYISGVSFAVFFFFGFMLLNRKLRFAFDLLLRALETLLSKFGKKNFVCEKKQKKQANKFNVSLL